MSMREMQRRRRGTKLLLEWTHPIGTPVVVTRDNGSEWETTTRSEPWFVGDGTPVIKLVGKSGGYALERVRKA